MSQTNDREPQRRARKLTPEQRRRILELRRRQRRKRQLMIAIPAAVALIVAVAVGLSFALGGKKGEDQTVPAENSTVTEAMSLAEALPGAQDLVDSEGAAATLDIQTVDETQVAEGELPDASAEPGASVEATAAPAATQSAAAYTPAGGKFVYDDAYVAAARGEVTGPMLEPDMSKVDASKLDRWPEVTEGYMPVTYGAKNVEEKIIAITVDDCFQAANLRQIVQCALDNNGKLTIFPIGDNLAREAVGNNVKWAWENGMEIENHTYNHVGMYHFDDDRMAKEIWSQSQLLNQILGVNYQQHFFRPKGGDERADQRVHAYVRQMGMNAIAVWGATGSGSSISKIVEALSPGQVYLFHTTDKDLEKLLYFIPYATQQGYRLVTMNEMFGLPENETSALTPAGEVPALEAFKVLPATLQKTSYIRAAAVVQKRLIELGWLEGEADGVFGESSYKATGCFQLAADIKATGKANGATQVAMFADDAPSATKENKAKVQEKMKK